MDEQTEFIGGPVGGRKRPLAGMAEVVAVPVDANLDHLPCGEPFAFALYGRRRKDTSVKYYFLRFERPNKEPFEAEFADGPHMGTHLCSQPPDYHTEEVLIPLADNGRTFTGEGEPSGVAIYNSKFTDGKWRFHLSRIEQSGENVEKVRAHVNETRAIQAVNSFYLSPDYSIYSKPPTDKHAQVFIEHGHRRAYVDEKLAPLIQALWERGLETLGSCQERPSGKAYVGFPLARQANLFHSKIAEAGIESEYKPVPFRIRNAVSGEIIVINAAHVHFFSSDIPHIINLVRGTGV